MCQTTLENQTFKSVYKIQRIGFVDLAMASETKQWDYKMRGATSSTKRGQWTAESLANEYLNSMIYRLRYKGSYSSDAIVSDYGWFAINSHPVANYAMQSKDFREIKDDTVYLHLRSVGSNVKSMRLSYDLVSPALWSYGVFYEDAEKRSVEKVKALLRAHIIFMLRESQPIFPY